MPHATRSMLSALVVACFCCHSVSAQEAGSRWWPFARQRVLPSTAVTPTPSPPLAPSPAITPVEPQAAPQYAPQQPSTSSVELDRPWMIESPFAKVSWPEFRFPEITLPKPKMPQLWPNRSQIDDTRNAWAGQNPQPAPPSPLQAVREGAQRVSDSTRAAWRKTVDTLTPGNGLPPASPPQVASREVRPPLWKRMFGVEEPPPHGPRTITEWMAQDRLDP